MERLRRHTMRGALRTAHFLLRYLSTSLRRVMRGAFANALPAKSGTHDVPVIAVGLPSRLRSPVVTDEMKAFIGRHFTIASNLANPNQFHPSLTGQSSLQNRNGKPASTNGGTVPGSWAR
jgi:hypothetical protein